MCVIRICWSSQETATTVLTFSRTTRAFSLFTNNRLVGLVVKVAAPRAENLGFDSCLCCGDFSRSSHSSDVKIDPPPPPPVGCPASWLALHGQHRDWSAQCQFTATGWGREFDLHLVS